MHYIKSIERGFVMAESIKLLQLRLPLALYEDLAQEVKQRKDDQPRVSLNTVAIEWMERGKGEL